MAVSPEPGKANETALEQDAEAEENVDDSIDFTVKLDRAASGTVTVDYATSDGSATAGADYTAASGTLTFAVGERAKTVAVELLDDSHDKGEETFTLTLSNPSGAVITDGAATGTIENHDPLPRALLARFGRAAATHVADHVEERLAARREPGFRARFAGYDLRPGAERELALSFRSRLGGAAGVQPAGNTGHGTMIGTPGLRGAPAGMPGLSKGAGMGIATDPGIPGGMSTHAMQTGTRNSPSLFGMASGGSDVLTDDVHLLRPSRPHAETGLDPPGVRPMLGPRTAEPRAGESEPRTDRGSGQGSCAASASVTTAIST